MKISLSWLNDYIETGLGAEEIAEILSDLGFPCEGIEQTGDDVVIDIEVTSNRGDCLGYIGVARELSAVTGKKLKIPTVELEESEKKVSEFAVVEIAEPDLCCRYTARIIEDVKVGPSPEWMVKRLKSVGIRSVNNVVDATNYAMMETGQPPHAFDYTKISKGKIVVRKAEAGEQMVSIDGSKCDLNSDMLIIADAQVPVAIAGVMGGLNTEVGESTTKILLEDAYFDPVTVRTTSRRLSLFSESSFRFERVVDVENIDWASKRTVQLITAVAGGKAAEGVVDIYPRKKAQKQVSLRLSRLKKLLGIEVPEKEVLKILSRLYFAPQQKNDRIECTVPSWRNDVYREADLIEEVARVHGYNKIPTEQKIQIEVVPVDERQKLTESIIRYLNGCGFYETINVTFVDDRLGDIFTKNKTGHLAVKDVSRKSANLLRQNLTGSLLGVMKTNFNADNRPCRIFEIADTFVQSEKKDILPVERTKVSLACDSDLRDLRGVVQGLIKNLDINAEVKFVPAELPWAQVGAEILVNAESIGTAGIISEKVQEQINLDQVTISCCELDFEKLSLLQSEAVKVKSIPRFPAVVRDLSLILDEKVAWEQIIDAVKKKAVDELEDVKFVGIYRGKAVPEGKKSVTLSLRFRDEDGTLRHEKVDGFESAIVKNLLKTLGAELRTV